MTRRASLYLLLIVGMGVVLNHVSWREKDGRQLWVVNEKEFDVRGIAQDTWNQLTRDCEGVTHVPPQAPQHHTIEKLIQGYSPPGSNSAQIKTLLSNANWALAEVVFDELFPAVVLLQHVNGQPHIVSHAIWSGYTSPWEPAPFIRQYLSTQAPQASPALMACFDPQTKFLSP